MKAPDSLGFALSDLTDVVRLAGREVLRWYDHRSAIEWKEDGSPLTEADRAAHRFLTSELALLCPGVPILSEESDEHEILGRRAWERFWLIDPLDGTKEFLKRTGDFTVNVALVDGGRPILGIVDAPARGRCYRGGADSGSEVSVEGGAFRPIRTRVPAAGPPVLVASRDHLGPGVRAFATALGDAVRFTSMGSSLKFCLVAEGEADYYLRDLPTMEWDTAAAQCVLEGAGGAVYGIGGDGTPDSLLYNRESLRNPPFLAVGDPEGAWRPLLAAIPLEGMEVRGR